MKNLSSKIIYGLAFAAVVYIIIGVWGSAGGLAQAFSLFSWGYLPLLLVIAFSNYLVRFIKWQYYLRLLKIKVPPLDSFIIFMSGLSLTITPGKMGEVIKSYFLKKGFKASVSRTAPIVLADRLSDLLAFLMIAGVGAYGFSYGKTAIWLIFSFAIFVILLFIIRPVGLAIFGYLSKIKLIAKYASRIMVLYETSYNLLKPKRLLFPLFVSLIAWSLEALDFYFILVVLKTNISALAAFFVYSFSTIMGAVMMLPGGLGVTDGSIAGLLNFLSVGAGTAAFATILIRVVTLWLAVILGLWFMLVAQKRYNKNHIKNQKSYLSADMAKIKNSEVPIKLVFHVHTSVSKDSWATPSAIVSWCRRKGVDVIAITDHNQINGAFEVKRLAKGNPEVIIGEEISTQNGEIIGLFLKKLIPRGLKTLEAIKEIKKQGGLVVLPHPGERLRRSSLKRMKVLEIIDKVDIVEVYNSRTVFNADNIWSQQTAQAFGLPQLYGSDAHFARRIDQSYNLTPKFHSQDEFMESLGYNQACGHRSGLLIQAASVAIRFIKKYFR